MHRIKAADLLVYSRLLWRILLLRCLRLRSSSHFAIAAFCMSRVLRPGSSIFFRANEIVAVSSEREVGQTEFGAQQLTARFSPEMVERTA